METSVKHWFLVTEEEMNEHGQPIVKTVKTLISPDQKHKLTSDKTFGLMLQQELKSRIKNQIGIIYDLTDVKMDESNDTNAKIGSDLSNAASSSSDATSIVKFTDEYDGRKASVTQNAVMKKKDGLSLNDKNAKIGSDLSNAASSSSDATSIVKFTDEYDGRKASVTQNAVMKKKDVLSLNDKNGKIGSDLSNAASSSSDATSIVKFTDEYDGRKASVTQNAVMKKKDTVINPNDTNVTNLDDNQYICGGCMLIIKGHENARKHLDSHDTTKCLWCFEAIDNIHMFQLHHRIHAYSGASKAKYICCPFCGNWFVNLEVACDHISEFHSEKEAEFGRPHLSL